MWKRQMIGSDLKNAKFETSSQPHSQTIPEFHMHLNPKVTPAT